MKKLSIIFPALFTLLVMFPRITHADIPNPWWSLNLIAAPQFWFFFIVLFIAAAIVNFIVLSLSFLIIKQGELIKSENFFKYILWVSLGGLVIDIVEFFWLISNSTTFSGTNLFIPIIIIMGLLLAIYNFFLAKITYHFNIRQAIFIGIMMGVLTNPAFWEFLLLKI